MLIDRRTGMAALVAGVATLGAATIATEFAWGARSSEVDAHLTEVGEIYLDGLVASLQASIERGSATDVERRLRSAMNQQNGIAERAIVVLDQKDAVANRVGNREVLADARMRVSPGVTVIDQIGRAHV